MGLSSVKIKLYLFVKKWICVCQKSVAVFGQKGTVFVKKWICVSQKVELCLSKSGSVFGQN